MSGILEGRKSRVCSVFAALLLAACSVKDGQEQPGTEVSSAAPVTVSCALGGASAYKDQCMLERSESEGRQYLVLRHPDGGFRRLEELEAGKRYKTIDGADEVAVDANGADVELTVGNDHYLFPGPQPEPGQSHAPQS